MLMRKEMILAVFIISVTLRTEPKLKIVSILLRSSADRTFMLGYCRRPFDFILKVLPSPYLSR